MNGDFPKPCLSWRRRGRNSHPTAVSPVDIMAVMSTGYTKFLLCLRNTCLNYFLQVPVCPVDRDRVRSTGYTVCEFFYRMLTGTWFSLYLVCPVDRDRVQSTGYMQ